LKSKGCHGRLKTRFRRHSFKLEGESLVAERIVEDQAALSIAWRGRWSNHAIQGVPRVFPNKMDIVGVVIIGRAGKEIRVLSGGLFTSARNFLCPMY